MSAKHAEIYKSQDELNKAISDGTLVAPWVAYIVDSEGNKQISFSNDATLGEYEANIAEEVMSLINNIRNGEVYCTESEYIAITTPNDDGSYNECVATQPDGTTIYVTYNPNVKYYIYE